MEVMIMRKLTVILTALLLLLLPGQALAAAAIPVYVEGQELAEPALLVSGTSYLPFRALLEGLDMTVTWDAATREVRAKNQNGQWLTVSLADNSFEASSIKNFQSGSLAGKAPFIKNGKTYLPLRVLAESLETSVTYTPKRIDVYLPRLTYDDGQGRTYILNLANGELALRQNGAYKLLGQIDLPSLHNREYYAPNEFSVSLTPHGNYLFSTGGSGSGALSFTYSHYAWLAADGQTTVNAPDSSFMGDITQPLWRGDDLWLGSKSELIYVNDKTGETKSYGELGEPTWADARFVLTDELNLLDLTTGSCTDLTPLLLTDEAKAPIDAWIAQDFAKGYIALDEQSYYDYVWALNPTLPFADPRVCLKFNAAKTAAAGDGTLYFDLWLAGQAIDPPEAQVLVYKLPA